MSEPKIPIECARSFAEINEKLSLLPPLAEKLDMISIAILGNGAPEKGVLMRLLALESTGKQLKRGWHSVIRWAVSVGTAVLLLLVGMWIKGA